MFEARANDNGGLLLVGRLDAAQVDKAKKAFEVLQATTTVDCAELEYISSAGLGVIVITQKRLKKLDATLQLINLSPHVRNVFHYAGLDAVFGL